MSLVLVISRVVVHGTAYFKPVPQQHGPKFSYEYLPGIGIRAAIAKSIIFNEQGWASSV